jgi:hypothetical protein
MTTEPGNGIGLRIGLISRIGFQRSGKRKLERSTADPPNPPDPQPDGSFSSATDF